MRCCGLGLVVLVGGCLDTNPLFVDPTEVPDEGGQAAGTTVEPTSTPGPTSETTTSPSDPTTDSASTVSEETTGPSSTMNVDTTNSSETEGLLECGNMQVDPGEECDDGNDVDDDFCRNDCTNPLCGDGEVQGYEGCDDGDQDDTDECPGNCLPAMCGDGFVYANGPEQCDDGNPDETDGCTTGCIFTKKYIFTSSIQYTGDLGGIKGADMKCKGHAMLGGLPGEYLAWLSDSMTSPAMRMTKHPGPYILPSFGEPVVALGWDDLTDGTLAVPIDSDEMGNSLVPTFEGGCSMTGVITNTDTAGNAVETMLMNNCYDWTSPQGAAHWGSTAAKDEAWTSACMADNCAFGAPIYCVQQ